MTYGRALTYYCLNSSRFVALFWFVFFFVFLFVSFVVVVVVLSLLALLI